ncbi:MAG TPA: DapH/DapD/GlmU-related protein [Kofleriaceae bacterium]
MYRWDRGGYLLFGSAWTAVRPLNFPVFLAFRAMGARGDIHYKADIDEGLLILHPDLGVVVSAAAVIGKNVVLTGGNCLGRRAGATDEPYIIGDDVQFGANATVIGPVTIGDRVTVGAGAVLLSNASDDAVLVGVPAKPTK